MKVNIVLSTVAIFCTFAASESAARNTRQAGRFGPSYAGNSGPNYGPGPSLIRPGGSQSINPNLGPNNRPTLTSGYSFGGPGPSSGVGPGGQSGRPLSGSVYGISSSGGRPSLQGGPGGPRPGSVFRGSPVNSGGRPVNSYKG